MTATHKWGLRTLSLIIALGVLGGVLGYLYGQSTKDDTSATALDTDPARPAPADRAGEGRRRAGVVT